VTDRRTGLCASDTGDQSRIARITANVRFTNASGFTKASGFSPAPDESHPARRNRNGRAAFAPKYMTTTEQVERAMT
jgi:hypothetical protein